MSQNSIVTDTEFKALLEHIEARQAPSLRDFLATQEIDAVSSLPTAPNHNRWLPNGGPVRLIAPSVFNKLLNSKP